MNISNSQVNRLRHFVRAGLRPLFRPEPQTAVEWADANYYLPKESAYQEGRWETLPFQRAIMNAMGSDYIREVNVVKSARVGYSVFEQSLLRYIADGLGVSYEPLSRNYAQMGYSTARVSANESWAHFMGRRKFVASRQASQMFLCWLEEAIVRRVVTLPSKARFSFQEARSAWGNCDWIGSGRMAIDGLKEVQEAVMLIEAGLSTYEKECAKRGDDYQEIFAQQVRETMERRAAGLKPPAWAAAAFESGLRQSTEEEKSDSRAA